MKLPKVKEGSSALTTKGTRTGTAIAIVGSVVLGAAFAKIAYSNVKALLSTPETQQPDGIITPALETEDYNG